MGLIHLKAGTWAVVKVKLYPDGTSQPAKVTYLADNEFEADNAAAAMTEFADKDTVFFSVPVEIK